MEIHDSVYYTCPYCDRGPLKAKASLRKHLYNAHADRAPPKEQINKFITTLVVTDEKVLRELAMKNERKIRNKSAKMQAKLIHQQQQQEQQVQQQQQQQQQHQQHQQQQQHLQSTTTVDISSPSDNFACSSPGPIPTEDGGGGIILYENELSETVLSDQVEDMLTFKTIFPAEDGGGSIGESSIDQMDHIVLEHCDQSSTCSSSNLANDLTTNHVRSHEDKKRKACVVDGRELQRLQHQMQGHRTTGGGGMHSPVDGKRMKTGSSSAGTSGGAGARTSGFNRTITSSSCTTDEAYGNNSLQESGHNNSASVSAVAASSLNGTGNALRYLRKNQLASHSPTAATSSTVIDLVAPSASSSQQHAAAHSNGSNHPEGPAGPHQSYAHQSNSSVATALDGSGQLNLDSLFGNISIDNYEFDDNATIQSFSLIEEKFKTSFDQIQEKLDAELPFGEEQIKWQNNIMTNDSSNDIGDKLLTGEGNIMLI